MSLAIEGNLQDMHVASTGQNARMMQFGIFAFSTTDANGELPVRMRRVDAVVLTPLGAPNTNELVYVDETSTDGKITVPDTGSLTIARTGTKTSGLKVMYQILGE